jgi:hypothetical protein
MSAFPPLFGVERTFVRQAEIDAIDPLPTFTLMRGLISSAAWLWRESTLLQPHDIG